MNYKKAIDILTSQGKFYINLGLDRIGQILELLGNPQDSLQIIHVAGTNGKGSVSAILATVLGVEHKIGLFTSPHIFNYTERVKINGVEIDKEVFARKVLKICDLAQANEIHLTEFEILTTLAFEYFSEQKVDFVVLETGLGGRFDATNIIKSNLCSVITNIDLDHVERLGGTIEKIAFEKAGIIKKNCPVVISSENKGFEVVKKVAEQLGAPLMVCENKVELVFIDGQNFAKIDDKNYEFNLLGLYQAQNLGLVIEVLQLLQKNLPPFDLLPINNVSHFARMTYDKVKNLLIDGAHNPAGAMVLRQSLDYYFPNQKFRFIFGCLNNKDYKSMMKNLFKSDDEVYFYQFNNTNSTSVEQLQQVYNGKKLEKLEDCKKLTVICGSFYMIDEVLSNFYS